MAEEKKDGIFKESIFGIVISRELTRAKALEYQEILENHNGAVASIDEPLDLSELTHIISNTSDFPEYTDAREQMINVVRADWIQASLMRSKESPVRPFTPDPNFIFSNVVVSCGDIPPGDQDAIVGAVLAMGGTESSTLTRLTTHVCALSVDHPKCVQAIEKGLKCKIVLPHWFDDCLKLGKRIDEGPYTFPDPEILRAQPTDELPLPPNPDSIKDATMARPEKLPLYTDTPKRRDVFKDKRVLISEDLNINNRLRTVLQELIERGGGNIADTVHEADMYVGHWREGRDYVFASRAGIDVGNLAWLYYLITHNVWTSPLKRLLHYPLVRGGIPGFQDLRITLSNYGGEARIYLENLIQATGAEFTKSMKQENTHLITARNQSEKCQAAKEWGIEMVNHLWIEESYAKCALQPLSSPRYTYFPPRTNLGEIIGQTPFDAAVLEEKFFPKDPTPSPEDPRVSREPMREKDRNLTGSKNSIDGDVAMGGTEDEVEPKKTPAPRPRSKSSINQFSTPASDRRRVSAGKENDTPSSTGSRSAKDKAVSRLHGLASDIALYEKEKKRKGPIWGGERALSRFEKDKSAERSISPAAAKAQVDEFSEEETRTPKRQKTSVPEVTMRLLITAYSGWLDDMKKEDSDKRKLRELGILVVQEPLQCTHLAAPNMVRTKKFLCALASGPTVISTDFIDACVKKKALQNVNDFLLKDTTNEKKFKLKLKDAVARAKMNKRFLLRGVPIYCTADVRAGWETYRDIVASNGGTCGLYKGRPVIKKISPEEDDGPAEPVYLISGMTPDEKKLWPKFTEMAKEGNMIPKIVTTDWILDVAMSQQLKPGDAYLVERA